MGTGGYKIKGKGAFGAKNDNMPTCALLVPAIPNLKYIWTVPRF